MDHKELVYKEKVKKTGALTPIVTDEPLSEPSDRSVRSDRSKPKKSVKFGANDELAAALTPAPAPAPVAEEMPPPPPPSSGGDAALEAALASKMQAAAMRAGAPAAAPAAAAPAPPKQPASSSGAASASSAPPPPPPPPPPVAASGEFGVTVAPPKNSKASRALSKVPGFGSTGLKKSTKAALAAREPGLGDLGRGKEHGRGVKV